MIEWGRGRCEALAIRKEIIAVLERGVPVSALYEYCRDEGYISMGRSTFYKHVANFKAKTPYRTDFK